MILSATHNHSTVGGFLQVWMDGFRLIQEHALIYMRHFVNVLQYFAYLASSLGFVEDSFQAYKRGIVQASVQ